VGFFFLLSQVGRTGGTAGRARGTGDPLSVTGSTYRAEGWELCVMMRFEGWGGFGIANPSRHLSSPRAWRAGGRVGLGSEQGQSRRPPMTSNRGGSREGIEPEDAIGPQRRPGTMRCNARLMTAETGSPARTTSSDPPRRCGEKKVSSRGRSFPPEGRGLYGPGHHAARIKTTKVAWRQIRTISAEGRSADRQGASKQPAVCRCPRPKQEEFQASQAIRRLVRSTDRQKRRGGQYTVRRSMRTSAFRQDRPRLEDALGFVVFV